MKITRFTLDLTEQFTRPVNINQFEAVDHVFIITIKNGSAIYDLTDCTVVFDAIKPDGHVLYNACVVAEDPTTGKVTYPITTQTSAADGKITGQIVITSASGEIRTPEFAVTVLKSVDNTNAVESTDEFTELQTAIETLTAYNARLTAVEDAATTLDNRVSDAEDAATALTTRVTSLETKAYGQAYRTSDYTIAAVSTWYPIDLDAGHNDLVNTAHSTSVNPSRLTVSEAGVYEITAAVLFKSNGATAGAIRVIKNGSTELLGSFANSVNSASDASAVLSRTFIASLAANDYIQLQFAGSNAGATKLTHAGYYGSTTTYPCAMLTARKIS